jgi:predicted nucleic acid-binding protein
MLRSIVQLLFLKKTSYSVEYGRIHAHLKKKGTRGAARDGRIFEERGTPIGAMDLLLAAHAVTLDAVLVTDNVSEFERVPRLKVKNWVNR